MQFTVFSDPHLHNFKQFSKQVGGLNSRLLDGKAALEHIAEYNVKNNIGVTLCAGDLFHTFSFVENDVMNVAVDIISKWPGKLLYVYGQHDLKVKENCQKAFSGSTVFEKMGALLLDEDRVTVDGLSVFGLGWRKPADFLRIAAEHKADILLGHLLPVNKSIPGGTALPEYVMDNYRLAVLGDLHIPGWLHAGKLLVPGAPLQHRFSDEGQERGFWTVDTETWKPTFHPIAFTPKFHTVQYVEDVPAFTLVGGRTVPNIDFYRVEHATTAEELPDNVAARKDMKQEFRESGLSSAMADAQLCAEYVKLQGPAEPSASALAEYGKKILERFESKALVPKDWRLASVDIHNFLSVRGRLVFRFTDGLHLVAGENGVGKTTVFEAVKWCLDGTTTKGVGADEVVNDDELKGCEVQTRFVDKDKFALIVKRSRTEFSFWIEGAETVQRESRATTKEELRRVLGMDDTMFKNVCYFSQEDFEFFSTMTDSGQKALCKNIRQIDRFEAAEVEAKRLRDVVTAALDDSRRKQELNAARLAELQQSVEGLTQLSEAWEADRSKKLKELEDGIAKLRADSAALAPKLTLLDEELADLDVRQKAVVLRPMPAELWAAVEKATKERDDLELVRKKEMATFDTASDSARAARLKAQGAQAECDADIRVAESELRVLDANVAALAGGTCSMCGQKLASESALDKAKKDREAAIVKHQGLQQKRPALYDAHVAAAKAEGLVSESRKSREEFYREQARLVEAGVQAADAAMSADRRAAELERATAVSGITVEITDLSGRRRMLAQQRDGALRLVGEGDRSLRELRSAVNEAAGRLETARIGLGTHNLLAGELGARITDASNELRMAEFWAKGFSDQGLVSYLLDGFAKEFTEAINVALLELSGGRFSATLSTQKKIKSGEWREKFELSVYVDGKRRPYKALSGGQKARVNLAAAVAFTEVVKRQFGLTVHPLGVMILDELITELDAEGAEAMYGVLERLSAGCAVYAITHQDSFKSLFSDVISVTYDKEKKTTVVEI